MKFVLSALVLATAALAAPQASDPHAPATSAPAPAEQSQAPHGTDAAPAAPKPTTAQEPDIQIPYGSTNALWRLQPADPAAWAVIEAPGVFNQTAHFAIKDQDKAVATFMPPQAFVGFEFWGYQRSDGGLYMLSIDGKPTERIDVYNKTAGPDDAPVLLYRNVHLERKHHVVEIKNLVDPRVHKAGQFNIDHVVITAAADPPRSDKPESTPAPPASTPAPSSPVPSSDPAPKPSPPAPPVPQNNNQTEEPPNAAPGAARASLALVAGAVLAALALL